MKESKHIVILGGGPAGLASGYYAKKNGYDLTIYEANSDIGGNAVTLKHNDFLYDSGAHRFHDKDPEITDEIKALLGDDLRKIDIPSQIYHEGRFIDFPISPLNLLANIGFKTFFLVAVEILQERLFGKNSVEIKSLYEHACCKYGLTIASKFLLNYSEKLWGSPCDNLSPQVSGSRINGLDLTTFILEALFGKKTKTQHLDGAFYYPTYGIGMITDKLADVCGREKIYLNSKITKILHNGKSINAIEINGKEIIDLRDKHVISTLPLPLLVKLMEPAPCNGIVDIVQKLTFRSLLLIGLFINKESITNNGSVYFPDKDFLFTRVYEPRNRSNLMSPKGHTSLIVELPCNPQDEIWNMSDDDIAKLVARKLQEVHGIHDSELIDFVVKRMSNAYPVLEVGVEDIVQECIKYFGGFENLSITGRNGKFLYTHLHDMMRFGKEAIALLHQDYQYDIIDKMKIKKDVAEVSQKN